MASDSGARIYAESATLANSGVVTAGDYTGLSGVWTITGGDGDNTDTFIATKSSMIFNDTGESFGSIYGLLVHCESTETADEESTTIYGIKNTAKMAGTHSDVANIYGSYLLTDFDGGTVDSRIYGLYCNVDVESGGTISDEVRGIQLVMDCDTDPSAGAKAFRCDLAQNVDVAWQH